MVDVGGEWCSWCHILDKFVEEDAEIRSFRDANFVWLKVNYSEENENKPFLSAYPEIKGYPHLFVLDADGKLLHSQFTGELEKGKGYDRAKFFDFMKAWAPAGIVNLSAQVCLLRSGEGARRADEASWAFNSGKSFRAKSSPSLIQRCASFAALHPSVPEGEEWLTCR